MNEHDNMTPAEMESYRAAIKEAYPAPKSDIHGNVMKQIRAERQLKIKKARQAAFIKWGSIAACLMIVCLVALKIVPDMDKLAAENNSGISAEADLGVARCYNDMPEVSDRDMASPEEYVVSNDELTTYEYSVKCELHASLIADQSTPTNGMNDLINGMGDKMKDDCYGAEAVPGENQSDEQAMTEATEETETDVPETESADEIR